MIAVRTFDGGVLATFTHQDEKVEAGGETLTEAIHNLFARFKQLQDRAATELTEHGFIHVVPKDVMS